jgi:glycosyltransferase involved in cell wall biosynthesis
MHTSPLDLSVIVRTCGRAPQFLRRALNSITVQTRMPSTIVVVNDGIDIAGARTELDKIDFRGITVKYLTRDSRLQAEPNRAAALNRGIAASDTRWIAFLDDDDTWTAQFLERVGAVLETDGDRTGFGGVVVQTLAVHEKLRADKIVEQSRRPYNSDLLLVDLAILATGNRFTINSMVVSRDVISAVGKYREDLPVLEDWEFNVRAAARFHFEVIPEPLVCYHLRPAGGGAAANSSLAEHRRVAVRIRNEWLRADLAAGRLGLGQLALAGEIRGLGGFLAVGKQWRDRIHGWWGKRS